MLEKKILLRFEGKEFEVTEYLPSFKDWPVEGRPATRREKLQATRKQLEIAMRALRDEGYSTEEILTNLGNELRVVPPEGKR